MFSSNEADALFKRLDLELMENIDAQYFSEPREFRSLNEVLEVLSQKVDQINRTAGDASNDLLTVLKDRNPAYSKLLNQRKIVEEVIEDVVKFQHGGLNHSVDTMSEVVREYTRGRDDIQGLRKSLAETQAVLTAKKVGQVPLKELWQKKVELQETLRIVKDLESLKSAPHRVQRLMQQKRYLSAVTALNKAITVMFGEDLVGVRGLSALREQLMDMKETLLETCVAELKAAVVASSADLLMKDYNSASDSEEEEEAATADNRSGSHVTSTHINDEVRSIVSQSHAGGGGGGGGGTSSGRSVAGGGGPGIRGSSEAWPVDLRDLDEGLETTLGDPSESGSLYIRLLVKTVGVLECEEDVERMVLDGVVDRFKESVVQQVRENAASKLAKELNREKRHSLGVSGGAGGAVVSPGGGRGLEEDDVLAVHRRLFTSFIGSLLDCTLQALRRVLYLLKLLYVSKTMRGGAAGYGYGAALTSSHIDADKAIKEHNKRQVLQVWMGMEELVVQQMLTHLVEPDVAGITDAGSGQAQGLVSKYGSQNRDGFLLLERSDRAEDDGEVELIFTPSARHAAPIFRRVVSYASLAAKILRDNALEELRQTMQAARIAHLSPSAPMGSPSRSNSSTSPLSSPTAAAGHGILEVIQAFLETELIPVIQSTVNHDMREIQMNNAYFSVTQNAPVAPLVLELGDEAADNETVIGGGNGRAALGPGQKRAATDAVPLCYAVQLCVSASRPLFSYWLQLHQHRSMVSTVLDRLIRGFASAAREELEGLTYSCMVMTLEGVHSSLIQSTKLDPLYRAYRTKVFGLNKASVEDLFGSAASATGGQGGASDASKGLARRSFMPGAGAGGSGAGGGGHGRRSLRSTHALGGADYADQDEARGRNALEVTVWEQLDFFDVGNHNYPVTAQKIVKDFPAVATVASISYACDWLIKRLSSFSSAAVKKVSAPSHHSPNPSSPQLSGPGRKQVASLPVTSSSASQHGGGSGSGGGAGAGGAGSRQSISALLKANKSELQEQKQLLVSTVVSGARELSKIAEEGMALLRGELQLICFYFLHRLAHVVYSPPSTVDGGAGSPHRKSFSGSPMAAQRASVAGVGAGRGQEEEGIGEEEAILSAFNAHLAGYLQAVVSSTSTDALAALLSPLCTVIPRILTHCAMHMVAENDKAESDDEGPEGGLGSDHYLKTHLLRMVVSVQQAFALQIQSFPVQLETKRRLTDLLTDGFERARRFITMFGMPASELKAYLKTNVNDYSKEEAEILWVKSTDRDATFAQLWKELENIPRTGPKPSAALHFSH